MKGSASVAAILAVSVAFLSPHTRADGPQTSALRVLASAGVKSALTAILPQIEHSIGRRVTTVYDASKTLREKMDGGEAFDVAILTSGDIDGLIQQGKIAANTRADFVRAGIGIGIRAGAPKPDISTPEALKRTLLNAKSITLNPNGASTVNFNKVLARLEIADRVTPKFVHETDLERLPINIVQGKAELVVALIPEIMNFQGVELAGPMPGDLQTYVNFVAGVSTNTDKTEASKALIKSITAPAVAPLLKAKGLEPR